MVHVAELKEGNFIKVTSAFGNGTAKVVSIVQNEIVVSMTAGSHFPVNAIDVEGIEITIDLLQRNGFQFDKVRRAYLDKIVLDPVSDVSNGKSSIWKLDADSDIQFESFHQLQNFFSNMGIALNII